MLWLAGLISIAFIGAALGGLYHFRGLEAFEMDAPQWGEFLAGLFGPPTFIMLLAGLAHQARTQRVHSDEMAKTLDAMRESIETSKRFQQGQLDKLKEESARRQKEFEQNVISQQKQIDAAETQSNIAKEEWDIDRLRRKVDSIARLALRTAVRLPKLPIGEGVGVFGDVKILRDDLDAGADLVFEEVRQALLQTITTLRSPNFTGLRPMDRKEAQRLGDLLDVFLGRCQDLQIYLNVLRAKVPIDSELASEIVSISNELKLPTTVAQIKTLHDALFSGKGLPCTDGGYVSVTLQSYRDPKST
jgi:hypothetical protein